MLERDSMGFRGFRGNHWEIHRNPYDPFRSSQPVAHEHFPIAHSNDRSPKHLCNGFVFTFSVKVEIGNGFQERNGRGAVSFAGDCPVSNHVNLCKSN